MKKNASTKEQIASLTFFSKLTKDELAVVSDTALVYNYSKDYVLYYEKKHSESIFFLLGGLAKAYKIDKHNNEIFLHYIYPDSIISDISNISDDMLYSFSNIKLLEDSQVLSINYRKFKELFLNRGILCSEFSNEIIAKSLQLQSLINREFIFNSVAKVAMMLYNDLDIFNKLKRSEISLILNIQPETLSRVLNRLKRDSIIDIESGTVSVLDRESLILLYEE